MEITDLEPARRIEFLDGFGEGPDQLVAGMPTMIIGVDFSRIDLSRTEMIVSTNFQSKAEMEQIISMGIEEGMVQALGQIDRILKS